MSVLKRTISMCGYTGLLRFKPLVVLQVVDVVMIAVMAIVLLLFYERGNGFVFVVVKVAADLYVNDIGAWR
ncbi:hypothetical protein QVD17_20063 [Tagetes erecta]|uniref:Uncharacterized protein n=1 Tax=Tagetes erecta TaxID=13708 RepID=A0AAD8NQN9_TARER|nr:hypothetical protein QVD17_20063 [Tagetes erecta]